MTILQVISHAFSFDVRPAWAQSNGLKFLVCPGSGKDIANGRGRLRSYLGRSHGHNESDTKFAVAVLMDELLTFLRDNRKELIQKLKDGKYKPNPVRRVEIPKETKGEFRKLGIPTVVDRVLQQAITQVLSPIYEKQFSENSYGFRPKRGAHNALKQCQQKDDDRKGNYPNISFDFLGYTFRPRHSKSKYGKFFTNFLPAISEKAKKAIRKEVRNWRLQLKVDKYLWYISKMFNKKIQGWINYYSHFYKSEQRALLHFKKT